jgi:hypothetical protein
VAFAILDTSVYVNHWEGRLDEDALAAIRARFIVRQSSVVLSEVGILTNSFCAALSHSEKFFVEARTIEWLWKRER